MSFLLSKQFSPYLQGCAAEWGWRKRSFGWICAQHGGLLHRQGTPQKHDHYRDQTCHGCTCEYCWVMAVYVSIAESWLDKWVLLSHGWICEYCWAMAGHVSIAESWLDMWVLLSHGCICEYCWAMAVHVSIAESWLCMWVLLSLLLYPCPEILLEEGCKSFQ